MSWVTVNVYDKETDSWHTWWENFYNHYNSKGYNFEKSEQDTTRALREWNAYNVPDSDIFRFRSEKYLTVFMLRWS